MLDLFFQGGPLFMGILTLILTVMLTVFVKALTGSKAKESLFHSLQWIRSIASLGLVVGILGQLIGLYSAFAVMESGTAVSSEILAGGLRVSMIPTLYGVVIFIIGIICNLILGRFV